MTNATASTLPPVVDDGRGLWHVLVSLGLAAFGFFLPFSTAGTALSMGALVLLAFLPPRRVWFAAPWKEPAMAIGLVLLAYIAVHTFWLSGFGQPARIAVNQYQELILAPILLSLLGNEQRRRIFLRAVFVGATALAVAYWVAPVVPSLQHLVAMRRISAGFVLAVCAFLLVMRAKDKPGPWPARIVAAFLAITVLYAIDGRTGHIVLVMLVAFAAWLHSPVSRRWPVSLGCLLFVLALAMSSGAVSGRFKETFATPGSDTVVTSTSIRIELMRVATELARRHWLVGAGFANYATVHAQAADRLYGVPPDYVSITWMRSANPHNEYLMQLISGGVIGLALFLGWLALAFRDAVRAPPDIGRPLAAVVFCFAVGCLFNSLLLDFVEAHFYVAVLACLVAQARAPVVARREEAMASVLVVATRQIGDVLLTTPLVRALRERWPQARVDVLGFEGTLGMLRGNPDISGLIESPARPGLRGWASLIARTWRRYDLAVITDAGDRAWMLGWVASPRRTGIVPARGGSNWWKRAMAEHAVDAAGDLGAVHVTAEKHALIAPWLGERGDDVPRVVVPPATALPADIEAALQPDAVVVHAPSMWPYKQWPLVHFEVLVKQLLAAGRQVVLTGSSGPRDQACIAPLLKLAASPQVLDTSGRLDFSQLVTLFGRAALYIGPDTSVSHLAAASGVPVIAIFGPTNPMRWAPRPAQAPAGAVFRRVVPIQQVGNVTLLQSSLHCVPCGKAGCEDHRQSRSDCLVDIAPERVMVQVRRLLAP